ncbi:macrophage mannose receptor 1-like [Actinia tenebrosa]|uniref:Macrophage mannose receptor 1-like n=1 Tax=Actinia tenebrosa TaxID=6105 RepID=A0A6P8I641_ACTTE|nr:macrophage mannose receptor 1-like [Actinia tenebrosa]
MSKLAFIFLFVCLHSALTSAKYLSCPQGWTTYKESSYCYRVGNKPTTKWKTARKACLSMGGDLVKIRSAQENRYVALLARTYSSSSSYMWLGIVGDSSNVFTWVDGSALSGQYSNWASGEPNRKAEDCGMMYLSSMKWNDATCVNAHSMLYVCEKEKPY